MDGHTDLQTALEDLLAQLWHARRTGDLGRLAHLGSSEVQRWGRYASESLLVSRARELLVQCPFKSREDLLWTIDRLIADVEFAHSQRAAELSVH